MQGSATRWEAFRARIPAPVGEFLARRGQLLLNLIVCFGLAHWVVVYTLPAWYTGQVDFVDTAFLVHNFILLVLVLVRTPHRAVDRNFLHQTVAMTAFFSGLAFQDVANPSPLLRHLALGIISFALVLGIATLLNLGRSFGILIALRQVKTGGLYRLVRHPMYLSDIVWKVGMLVKKPCWFNAAVCVVSVGCYAYRAILEERFLAQTPEYREYMQRVRCRFLPGIF